MYFQMADQLSLFPKVQNKFPKTRYQGSKAKLANWIWDKISGLSFETCLDAFGGTGTISYLLKQEHKQVTYNDSLKFNFWIGLALIENSDVRLHERDVDWILKAYDPSYPTLIADTFTDIYYLDEENAWLDNAVTNIHRIENKYKRSLAFFALAQSCIIKRPTIFFTERICISAPPKSNVHSATRLAGTGHLNRGSNTLRRKRIRRSFSMGNPTAQLIKTCTAYRENMT